ncbi:MmyB family transcriptional regulator [Streptomyces europaeiscabiei]|uniref:MmyB family transcriptional regulator n=1 Tax=Streptomyces europaeiscabiei TaxID=146819 RepID=UPI0038F67F74
MAYQAGGQRSVPRPVPDSLEAREAQAYLQDYAVLQDSVLFPSVILDHRWDVVLTNAAFRALFNGVGPHPTAMPGDNFLRFVLFHPDAATVLGDHESSWCLPMLAHFATAVEHHPQDRGLQSIRRDIAQDPIMDAAYRHGLPHWLRTVGPAAGRHDGAVRPLVHPDPRWGATLCRIVGETPDTLRDMGYHRMTLVLREVGRPSDPLRRTRRPRGAAAGHLSVVPSPER